MIFTVIFTSIASLLRLIIVVTQKQAWSVAIWLKTADGELCQWWPYWETVTSERAQCNCYSVIPGVYCSCAICQMFLEFICQFLECEQRVWLFISKQVMLVLDVSEFQMSARHLDKMLYLFSWQYKTRVRIVCLIRFQYYSMAFIKLLNKPSSPLKICRVFLG